ncbi:MAG: hypothetical protein V4671_22005 [Armatimonadota bacterium]
MRMNSGALLAAVALATSTALLAPQVGAQLKPQARQKPQKPQAPEPKMVCRDNLRQIAIAMMMYVQDNDQTFPQMQSAAQVQNRLRPYLKNMPSFSCPVTRQPYQPVKALSGKPLASIKYPATTPMLSEAKAHPDGTKHTAYAEGHVKSVRDVRDGK